MIVVLVCVEIQDAVVAVLVMFRGALGYGNTMALLLECRISATFEIDENARVAFRGFKLDYRVSLHLRN